MWSHTVARQLLHRSLAAGVEQLLDKLTGVPSAARCDRGRRRRPASTCDARGWPRRRERRADPVRDAPGECRRRQRPALAHMHHPSIYVIDPAPVSPTTSLGELRRSGRVNGSHRAAPKRGPSATRSLSPASPTGPSGGGSKNLATASCSRTSARPLDAPAAALARRPRRLRAAAAARSARKFRRQLAQLPGRHPAGVRHRPTKSGPVRGVYNRGWLIGDDNGHLRRGPG